MGEFLRIALRVEKANHMDSEKPGHYETSAGSETPGESSKLADGAEDLQYHGSQLKRTVCEARTKLLDSPRNTAPRLQPDKGVLVSRSRLEAMLGELRRLMEKAAELEAELLDWRKLRDEAPVPAPVTAVPMAGPLPCRDHEGQSSEGVLGNERLCAVACESFMRGEQKVMHYSQMNTEVQRAPAPEGIEATVHACLLNNPDLAGDPDKLRMVQYCFTNYVNIDPDLSGLSLPERLERASQMAREFLGY